MAIRHHFIVSHYYARAICQAAVIVVTTYHDDTLHRGEYFLLVNG
jgi:hypothetical protein